jgi:hypothetical protein
MILMNDDKLEKIMDKWASHEVESAPEMRPTEEMYKMIEARKRKNPLSSYARRILVGIAAIAAVLLLIVLPTILYMQDKGKEPALGLKKLAEIEKRDIITKHPHRRGKGPKKRAVFFHRLMLQYQKNSQSVYEFDIRFPQEEKLSLTSDDFYRFSAQTNGDHHVHIYQLDPRGRLTKLFPNNAYSSAKNPLQKGQTYYIPSVPNWFYPGKDKGEERIYVVASAQIMLNLEELYEQYTAAEGKSEKQQILSRLLQTIEDVDKSENAVIWTFKFSHQ